MVKKVLVVLMVIMELMVWMVLTEDKEHRV